MNEKDVLRELQAISDALNALDNILKNTAIDSATGEPLVEAQRVIHRQLARAVSEMEYDEVQKRIIYTGIPF